MSYIVILGILGMIIGFTKAVSDLVSHYDTWSYSIFWGCNPVGFWGPKDRTWKRKQRKNKFLNWLFSTVLVWTTDLWHFSNSINMLCYLGAFFCAWMLGQSGEGFYMLLMFPGIRTGWFHVCYHYALRI